MEYEPTQKADNNIHCKNNQQEGLWYENAQPLFQKLRIVRQWQQSSSPGVRPLLNAQFNHSWYSHENQQKQQIQRSEKTALRHLKNINYKMVSLKKGIQSLDRKFPRNDYH